MITPRKVMNTLAIFMALMFFPLIAKSQDQLLKHSSEANLFFNRSLDLPNGLILFGGIDYDKINNTKEYSSYLYSYDPNTDLIQEVLNQGDMPNGGLNDMILLQNGGVVVLLDLFYSANEQRNEGRFRLMYLDQNLNILSIKDYTSKTFNRLYVQELISLDATGNSLLVGGSYRLSEFDAKAYYFAKIENQELMWQDTVRAIGNYLDFDDLLIANEKIIISEFSGFGFASNFHTLFLEENTIKYEKTDTLPFSMEAHWSVENGVEKIIYSSQLFRDIYQINDSILVGGSNSYRLYTIKTTAYDTSSVGVYFFSPDIDSLKYVDLSTEYITSSSQTKSYITALDYGKRKNLCFSGLLNQELPFDSRPEEGVTSGVIAMLNDTGKVLWNHSISENETHIRLTTAISTSDGGCVFAGDYFKEGESQGRDLLIVAMDSLGTLTSISDESLAHLFDQQKIAIYPNPAKSQGKINLSWSGMQKQNWQIKFYDKKGRLVHSTDILQGVSESTIQLPELPSGNYIIRAEGSGKQVHTGTVVVD